MNLSARAGSLTGWVLVGLLTGCSTHYYFKSADKEVYGTIVSKTPQVPNMDTKFSIEQTNNPELDGLPITTNAEPFLGAEGERERGAHILTLEESLGIAIHSSRAYQTRKEQLYLSGLTLTLARHQYAPIFSANANVNY